MTIILEYDVDIRIFINLRNFHSLSSLLLLARVTIIILLRIKMSVVVSALSFSAFLTNAQQTAESELDKLFSYGCHNYRLKFCLLLLSALLSMWTMYDVE
jgi:hypothetical protein